MLWKERTLVLLKPDAVQRNLIGEIITRFERVGLKIIAMKFLIPTKEQAYKHYVKNEEEIEALGKRSIEGKKKSGIETNEDPKELGQKIIDRLVRFLSSGPIVAMVLEGNQAVAIVRKLVGSTEPLQSDVGTIRGDFTLDSYAIADNDNRAVRNLVHASSSVAEAEYEIKVWFDEKEIFSYNSVRDRVLYDVNLDNINE
ncbi:MAG: nucleoside-diphosphate kinase [Candidatus Parcubacteria bacterium]|nr:MAG: nucleoside-diphosphate kinase [Candidatus Parcubacteria bacterium]